MIRCCLCRRRAERCDLEVAGYLPGTGYRCVDRDACAQRVRDIVSAHKGWAEI